MNPRLGFRPRILAAAVLVVAAAVPVSAQVDPLLFLKTAPPNVISSSIRRSRMQRSAPTEPGDRCHVARDQPLLRSVHLHEERRRIRSGSTSIGVTDANTDASYRRRYNNLEFTSSGIGDKFTASTIQTAGDRTALFALFEAQTRLAVARAALYQAVDENKTVARFGLVKMRQTNPGFGRSGKCRPVWRSPTRASNQSESGSLWRPMANVPGDRRRHEQRRVELRPASSWPKRTSRPPPT